MLRKTGLLVTVKKMEGGSRRDAIASAALTVLIAHGLRGFTHRAVDAAAGLRPGSVNYYFDSRDKLLGAALDELFRQDAAATTDAMARHAPLFSEPDLDLAARGFAELVEELSGPDAAPRLRARQELLCEAQRRPAFRARFEEQRLAFVGFAEHVLSALGAPEQHVDADALVVLLDGLMGRQVLLGGPRLRPDDLTHIIRSWLTAVGPRTSAILGQAGS